MLDGQATAALEAVGTSFAFGRFILHQRRRQLLVDGQPVEIGSRAFDVLLTLVQADGALVTKTAIRARVWPDVIVDENNLQVQISSLRRTLGSDRDWISTIPGRGYRFIGPVAVQPSDEPAQLPRLSIGPPRLSILVLPFAGRGGDPAQDWFTAAITDSLTTDLARSLPGSTVIAQTTADTYKGRPADAREIGREQGVRFILEGSVLFAEEQVRVNAQLIEAETGAHLWAERFDKPRRDVLRIQDEIVGRLSRSVGLHMIDAEARRAEWAHQEWPERAEAFDFVLRGHAAANQCISTREGIETACALYASALQLDPDCVGALAGIACLRIYQVVIGYSKAGQTVLDDDTAREKNLAEAEEKLARALVAVPGDLAALKGRAMLLRARGAFTEAITDAETVLAHNPGEPMAHREIGLSLLCLGRAEEAVAWFLRADTLAPNDPTRWTWLQGLGRALIQLGRDAEAVKALRLAVGSNPAFAVLHALLAAALALTGDTAHARTHMAEFRRTVPGTTIDDLARRCAVLYEATDPMCRRSNERVLDGLRRADAAYTCTAHTASGHFRSSQCRPQDASGTDGHLPGVGSNRHWSKTMRIIDEQRPQTTAKSLARMLYPDPGRSATPRNAWHGGLAGLLHRLAARITAMSERRATVKQLAEMSDRELAELGLSRGRLHGVFELKFARASSSRPRSDGLKTQAGLGESLLRPLAG